MSQLQLMCGVRLTIGALALLNCVNSPKAETAPSVRSIPLNVESGEAGFALIEPQRTGVLFTNVLDEWSSAANRVLENGSGVALGDIDGDGMPDIFLCSLTGENALFRNLGNFRFTNVISSALKVSARGALFADVNGDQALDLLMTTLSNGVVCFLNDGTGRFTDGTASANLAGNAGATTLAMADIDGDGTPDLYVAAYRPDDIRDRGRIPIQRAGGKVTVSDPALRDRVIVTENGSLLEFGDSDALYRSDGQGVFRLVSWTNGAFVDENGTRITTVPRDWGLAAAFHDINGDGAPDLFVCNDYWSPDRFWINRGDGNFQAISRAALRRTSENSMGVDFADINRDGHLDFFVTDMLSRDSARQKRQAMAQTPVSVAPGEIFNRPQYMRNMLFLNRGDGTFAEIADYAGVSASEWSWQPVFIDVDLDGFEDLVIPAGHTRDVQDLDATERIRLLQRRWPADMDLREQQREFTGQMMEHARLYPRLDMPIIIFRNRGDLTFEDMTAHWGTHQPGVHQGIAFGDLDGDGDLDFVVNNLNSAAGVYRNNSSRPRVAVRLSGRVPNTGAIGARVTLRTRSYPPQAQEATSGGRYLSGFDGLLVFAADPPPQEMTLEVIWRNGRQTRIEKILANQRYEIRQAE